METSPVVIGMSSCARGFCGRDVVGDVSCGGPMVVSSMLCSSVGRESADALELKQTWVSA